MKFTLKKKLVAGAIVAAVAVVAGGGAAFAYWTSSGGGSGGASTGTSSSLTIAQTNTVSGLVPNGPPQTINYTVTNGSTSSAEFVNQVNTTVFSVASGALSSEVCTTAMYAIVNGPALATDLAAGGTASGTATIQLVDDGNNQNNCQGAAVVLHFTSN